MGYVSAIRKVTRVCADAHEVILAARKRQFIETAALGGKNIPRCAEDDSEGSDTARLKNSIRAKSDADSFAVGTNLIYARRHQFGDKVPLLIKAKTKRGLRFQVGGRWITKGSVKVKMPARPFLGISEDDIEEIKSILEREIDSD